MTQNAIDSTLATIAAEVTIDPLAQEQFEALPRTTQARVAKVFERLEKWPKVSGVKALTGDLKGSFRIRTGDYRVVYRVRTAKTQGQPDSHEVLVWRIGYRGDVYD